MENCKTENEFIRSLIADIKLVKSNTDHISESGIINGSLLMDLISAFGKFKKHLIDTREMVPADKLTPTKPVWQVMYSWQYGVWHQVSDEWYEDMKNATANKYRQVSAKPYLVYKTADEWELQYLSKEAYERLNKENHWKLEIPPAPVEHNTKS